MSMVRTTLAVSSGGAALEQLHQLAERALDVDGVAAVDDDFVAAHDDGRAGKRRLDGAQDLVVLADERGHQVIAGNEVGGGGDTGYAKRTWSDARRRLASPEASDMPRPPST